MRSNEEGPVYPFTLGQYAGDIFALKVNQLLKEFKEGYESEDYNFDDPRFYDGFTEAFVDGFDQD